MPATRIDVYKKGGFYGDMRTHHRADAAEDVRRRRCAGCRGRWTTRPAARSGCRKDAFGPLGGQAAAPLLRPLHGRSCCCARSAATAIVQGGRGRPRAEVPLRRRAAGASAQRRAPVRRAASTAGRPRRRPDGCLQRVRYTGKPLDVPVTLEVEGNAIRLTFSRAARREERSTSTAQLPRRVVELPLERRLRLEAVEGVRPEGGRAGRRSPCRAANCSTDGRTVEVTVRRAQAGDADAGRLQREGGRRQAGRRLGVPHDQHDGEVSLPACALEECRQRDVCEVHPPSIRSRPALPESPPEGFLWVGKGQRLHARDRSRSMAAPAGGESVLPSSFAGGLRSRGCGVSSEGLRPGSASRTRGRLVWILLRHDR